MLIVTIFLLFLDWSHPRGDKYDKFDFKIVCLSRCKNLEVIITHSTGDVDLYGEADEVPHIVYVLNSGEHSNA